MEKALGMIMEVNL